MVETNIPIKFISILLIIDISIGMGIIYQIDQGNLGSVAEDICEQGELYTFSGYKWLSFPIKYFIDNSMPFDFIPVIEDSMDTWEDDTGLDLFEKSDSYEASDLLFDYKEITYQSQYFVLGLTTTYGMNRFAGDPAIAFTELTLNPFVNWKNLDFSCKLLPINYPGPFDIKSVTLHELGHVLGLDHTNDEFTTMHTYYIGTFQQTLSRGDIRGFNELYNL